MIVFTKGATFLKKNILGNFPVSQKVCWGKENTCVVLVQFYYAKITSIYAYA